MGTPAAPSITRCPPLPPSAAPSPDRVGAIPRPPPSRQLVTSADRQGQSVQFIGLGLAQMLNVSSDAKCDASVPPNTMKRSQDLPFLLGFAQYNSTTVV